MSKYFLYILHSSKINQYYIGISSNPGARLISHNSYPKGWTKRGYPWELVFKKEFPFRKAAAKWEKWLKQQKSRTIISRILRGEFDWTDDSNP